MPVYVVTGKLGSGKSLIAVSKLQEYLLRGRPVATNLDLNMRYLVGKNSKRHFKCLRLPDHPKIADFEALGYGNHTPDESLNGAIFLDECATWFNARDWNNPDRRAVNDWMIHARKRGWDLYFIMQSHNSMDKQARQQIAEHVVYCRRFDRIPIPFLTPLAAFFTIKLTLPKGHFARVLYGTERNSPKVDTWVYRGKHLYQAYDTKQIFNAGYDSGIYSYLPPKYLRRPFAKTVWDWRKRVRLTKIIFRKYSRGFAFLAGSVLSAVVVAKIVDVNTKQVLDDTRAVYESQYKEAIKGGDGNGKPDSTQVGESSMFYMGSMGDVHLVSIDGVTYDNDELAFLGYSLKRLGDCRALLFNLEDGGSKRLTCKPYEAAEEQIKVATDSSFYDDFKQQAANGAQNLF